jgi:hypothetical protein
MEAICSSETSVGTQRTTWRYIPEDGTLHRLRVFEDRVLKRIFGLQREEVTEWKNYILRNFTVY